MTPIIELLNLEKHYGSVHALSNVNLEIGEGELVSLIGPSGAGKSTLIRLLAGEELPSGGEIRVRGRDVTTVPPARRGVAVVYQDYSLFPHMSVFENVVFPIKARLASGIASAEDLGRDGRKKIEERVLSLLEDVELRRHRDKTPDMLSGGEQQRAAIARAMGIRPDLICFDEPFSALDVVLRRKLREQVMLLKQNSKGSFLYVTHNVDEAFALSDRIGVLIAGSLMQVDKPRTVYMRPATRAVAEFTGEVSFLEVRETTGMSDTTSVTTALGTKIRYRGRCPVPGEVIGIRPEAVVFNDDNAMTRGRIKSAVFEGGFTRILVCLEGGENITATVLSHRAPNFVVGDEVALGWDQEFSFILSPQ